MYWIKLLNLDIFKLWTGILGSGSELQAWDLDLNFSPNWFKSISLVWTNLNLSGRERHIWNANENIVVLTPKWKFRPCSKPTQFQCYWSEFLHGSLAAILPRRILVQWQEKVPVQLLLKAPCHDNTTLLSPPGSFLVYCSFRKFFAVTKQNTLPLLSEWFWS